MKQGCIIKGPRPGGLPLQGSIGTGSGSRECIRPLGFTDDSIGPGIRNPWDLGLQVHQVPIEPLLDKIGIPYDPEMKFRGVDGQDLGKPESPSFLKFYPV
jgi:hypothetical protein